MLECRTYRTRAHSEGMGDYTYRTREEVAAWRERYAPAIGRLKSMIEELKRQGNLDLAVLSVLLRELRALA